MSSDERLAAVLTTIHEVCGIKDLAANQDFYDAGVTSVQALPLLMELEARFDVAISDDQFVKARTPGDLCAMIGELPGAGA